LRTTVKRPAHLMLRVGRVAAGVQGMRAFDIRDPYNPVNVAFFIPEYRH